LHVKYPLVSAAILVYAMS